MSENSEPVWIVHWDGPFSIDEATSQKQNYPGYVLYLLYGYHNLYGFNSLLYLGQTSAGIKTRLGQHDDWIKDEYDEVSVRLGSVSKFTGWDNWQKFKNQGNPYKYPKGKEIIERIEKLLIYANQPAYNVANKNDSKSSNNLRVFNSGHFGSIFPEISSWYFLNT